jgi:serine/threonine protein kinase
MASVWVARLQRKHGFEKLVAIKTILPKFAEDIRFQQMFLDEARIASRIEHANVAHILDLGDEHDVLYLVMEWVDGEALSKLNRAFEKKGQRIPLPVLLRVIADTCGGLHAAHELRGSDGELLGVVHRDVSPQNILMNTKGVAKLIDFGIAKARDRVAEDTNAGLLKGKIQYMAPEQALGKTVDRRADVWALGAILYHLIAGHPPYEGENQLATLHLLTSGRPPIPLPPSVPPAISAVIRRTLAQDPARRYATAAELQAALESAMVAAGIVVTTADVAACVAEHMGERAEARKQSIDLALKAAAERVRMQTLLQPPSSDSASGVLDASGARTSVRTSVVPSSGQHPAAMLSGGFAAALPQPAAVDGGGARPVSEVSNATLGSASLESPLPPPASRMRGLVIGAGIAAVLGVAAAGVVAVRIAGKSPAATTVAAREARPPSAAASASSTQGAAAAVPSATVSAAPSANGPGTASAVASVSGPPTTTARPWVGFTPPQTGAVPAATATTAATAATTPAAATAAKPPPKPGVVDDGF